MGILSKNIPKVEQDLSNVPEGLQVRRKNAIAAGYNFDFDDKEKKYIAYNKLRSERPDQERVQIAKVYRLKDRDTEKEYLVYYQTSKTEDYEGNLIKCPQVEKIGVENRPKTTKHKNSQNQITDIELVETENDFYVPYSESKLKQLFDKSRNSQNIVCYIGYCKPVQSVGTDYITDKKRIKDQVAFMSKDFEELIQLPNKNNVVNTYSKVGKKKKMKSSNPNENEAEDAELARQEKQEEEADNDDGLLTQEEYNEGLEEKIKNNELPKIASTESIIQKPRFAKKTNKSQEENKTEDEEKKKDQPQPTVFEDQPIEVDSEDKDTNDEEQSNNNGNNNNKLKIGSLD